MKKSFFNLRPAMLKGVMLGTVSALALTCMTACSDDDLQKGGNEPVQTEGVGVNAITDQSILGDRVHNYKKSGSRAEAPNNFKECGLTSMPDYDAIVAAAAAATQIKSAANIYNDVNAWGVSEICIDTDADNVQFGSSDKNIYVKGNIKVTNVWGSNYNVYILKGGSVTWAMNNSGNLSASQANVKYYNFGTLNANSDGEISLYNCTKLYNAADATLNCKTLRVNGGKEEWDPTIPPYGANVYKDHSGFYAEGDVKGIQLIPETGCMVNIDGQLKADGLDLKFDGEVRVNDKLTANSLSIINNGHLYSECGVILDKDFSLNANGSFAKVKYVKAANAYQCAGSAIKLSDQSMLDIAGLYQNLNNGNAAQVELITSGTAVVKAKEMHWNAGDPLTNVYLFQTPVSGSQIVTDCEKYARLDNNMNPVYYEFNEFEFMGGTVKRIESDADRTMKIEKDGCNENGYNDNPVKPEDPVIDVVTDIDHNHDISATCIQYYNGKVYASYHQRGAAQHGCLEVFETNSSDVTTLLQYVEDENGELDFNHLILDNGKLITVGNHVKKGGILAHIDLDANGLMNTEARNTEAGTAQPLTMFALKAQAKGDGNCIIRNGDYYNVMSTSGFETYSVSDFSRVGFVPTPGKAKHVAIGNGNIYATYLTTTTTDENEEIPVEMKIFSATPSTLDAATSTVSAGVIQPNNGKNVVKVDPSNGNVYVCLGRDGLKCLSSTGATQWTFQPEKVQTASGNYKAFCNGVTADENYIYVAYGTFGLIILDKSGNQIAQAKSVKSANYVSLADGYIYVAYGRERIRVYKFYPEGVEGFESDYGVED